MRTFIISNLLTGIAILGIALSNAKGQTNKSTEPSSETRYLVIRTDDAGMSHSVNMGLQKLLESTDLPVSVSIMFPCPWYQEAVDILKKHPKQVTAGIHLTVNSEWEYYRWGPVAGQQAVPSLVDSNGYFFHSAEDLYGNQPDLQELETELRAQIERAIASDLDIQYMDAHMGTVFNEPKFRKVVEKLANEYELGLFGYFNETSWSPQYRAEPNDKIDSLTTMIPKLKPGYNYLVSHVGINNPELATMKDMNSGEPLANMGAHRQGVLDALISPAFRQALEEGNLRLVSFKEIIEREGLDHMKSPFPKNQSY